jgi:hypothetical protein
MPFEALAVVVSGLHGLNQIGLLAFQAEDNRRPGGRRGQDHLLQREKGETGDVWSA